MKYSWYFVVDVHLVRARFDVVVSEAGVPCLPSVPALASLIGVSWLVVA